MARQRVDQMQMWVLMVGDHHECLLISLAYTHTTASDTAACIREYKNDCTNEHGSGARLAG